jgi:DNA/RNA endonuclease YhcR with UshA esterase domain
MRRFRLILLFAAFTTCRVIADDAAQPPLVDASDRAALEAAIGKIATVQGVVSRAEWSRSGAVLNIDFKNAEKSRFFAVVFEKNREKLDEAFLGDVAKVLTGAKVRLRGTIEAYDGPQESFKGRPQMIISLADQITILELPQAARQ